MDPDISKTDGRSSMKDSLDSDIDLSGQQHSSQENHTEMNVSNPQPEILPMTNQPMSDADNNQLLPASNKGEEANQDDPVKKSGWSLQSLSDVKNVVFKKNTAEEAYEKKDIHALKICSDKDLENFGPKKISKIMENQMKNQEPLGDLDTFLIETVIDKEFINPFMSKKGKESIFSFLMKSKYPNPRVFKKLWEKCDGSKCSVSMLDVAQNKLSIEGIKSLICHQKSAHGSNNFVADIFNDTRVMEEMALGKLENLCVYLLNDWSGPDKTENVIIIALKMKSSELLNHFRSQHKQKWEEYVIPLIERGSFLKQLIAGENCILTSGIQKAINSFILARNLCHNDIHLLLKLNNGDISKAVVGKMTHELKMKTGFQFLKSCMLEEKLDSFSELARDATAVNACEPETGQSIIHYALDVGRKDALKELLKNHANLASLTTEKRDNVIVEALQMAQKYPKYTKLPDILMVLFEAQTPKELKKILSKAPNVCHVLLENGRYNNAFGFLLKNDIMINERDSKKRLPIYYSIANKNHELTYLLLHKNVLLEDVDGNGNHAVHISLDDEDLLHLLLKRNSTWIGIENSKGETVMILVAKDPKYHHLFKRLLKYKPDLQKREKEFGKTALNWCSKNNDLLASIFDHCDSNPCLFSLPDNDGNLPINYNSTHDWKKQFCPHNQCWSQQTEILLKNKKVLGELKNSKKNSKKWKDIFQHGNGILHLATQLKLQEEVSLDTIDLLLELKLTSGFKESLKMAFEEWDIPLIKKLLAEKRICSEIEYDQLEFCQFVKTANNKESSALMVLSLKLPEDKETLISQLRENVAFSTNELVEEQKFLALVDLNDRDLTREILNELTKSQKETIGRKALLRSLEKKHLESVLPLISDQEVPLSTPESTSNYLNQAWSSFKSAFGRGESYGKKIDLIILKRQCDTAGNISLINFAINEGRTSLVEDIISEELTDPNEDVNFVLHTLKNHPDTSYFDDLWHLVTEKHFFGQDENGDSPLHIMSKSFSQGMPEKISKVLQKFAPNQEELLRINNSNGDTPLKIAIDAENIEAAKVLMTKESLIFNRASEENALFESIKKRNIALTDL